MDAREDPLNARGLQPEHALEQPCEHRTIIRQDRIVAVLKKVGLVDLHLFSNDAAAIDAASHHPVDTAVAVIGAAVAILPEGAPKLGDDDDNRISPSRRSNLFGKTRKRAAKFAEPIGEISGGSTLINMGIPAADIDKAEVELFAHQPADAPRRQLEAARRNRTAIGRGHFFGDRFVNVVANSEAFRNRRSKITLRVHILDQPGLPIVDARLANAIYPEIRNLGLAAKDQRKLIGKGDRSGAREFGGKPAHKA